jgi:hypothetical protein
MNFCEKIDKLKAISKLSLKALGDRSGLKTTLEKAYGDNREMKDATTTKFLQNLGINSVWWETQKGEILLPDSPLLRPQKKTAGEEYAEDFRRHISNLEKNIEDLRARVDDQQKLFQAKQEIDAMEETIKEQDRLLATYRQALEKFEEKLTKEKQTQ